MATTANRILFIMDLLSRESIYTVRNWWSSKAQIGTQGLALIVGKRSFHLELGQVDPDSGRHPAGRIEFQILDRAQPVITALPFVECCRDAGAVFEPRVHLFRE